MPDAKAQAEMEAEVQERLAGPPPIHTRNINADVHSGYAAQRPWAAVEDQMGAASGAYPNFEALRAALPKGDGNEIEQDAAGNWVRYVPKLIDTEDDGHGHVVDLYEDVPRLIALSREDARARSQGGLHVDYFDGYTWWRDGRKPERDIFVAQQQGARRNLRRVARNVTLDERREARNAEPVAPVRHAAGGQTGGAGSGAAAGKKE